MSRIYLKNATAPHSFLVIDGRKIEQISQTPIEGSFDKEVDLKGKTIFPGLIDMQVHLREPGFEYKETIESGSMAAARGGFTTIACMPNTSPAIDSKEVLMSVMAKAETSAKVEVLVIPAMTKDLKGKEVVDYKAFKDLGVVGVTDDGKGVQDDEVMKKVFQNAAELGLSVLQHCEFDHISNGGSIHEGEYSKTHGVKGIPSDSEWKMVERDIELLKQTGGHYHVLHVSSEKTLELVRDAKSQGLNVTAEVTPHHLLLCDEDIPNLDPNFKMNPPLRSSKDREALINGLVDGTIDMVSTDHAPHAVYEKEKSLEEAPFGVVGLETAFPLLYTHLVKTGKMSLERLTEVMSYAPQDVFKINRGRLEVGALADIAVIDLESEKEVSVEDFESKSQNSPFINWKLQGWPVMTIKAGEVVYGQSHE